MRHIIQDSLVRDGASGTKRTFALTADVTLGPDATGTVYMNEASATVTATLPSAVALGTQYLFMMRTTDKIRITPASDDALYIDGQKQTDGYYLELQSIGTWAIVTADDVGDWFVQWYGVVQMQP